MDVLRLWSNAKKKGAPNRSLPAGRSSDDLCPSCLRNGRVYCPHKPMLAIRAELAAPLKKQDFFGPSPPNLFVGHFGWPSVNWGPMVSLTEGIPDNPKDWYGWNFDQIVRARSMQVRGQSKGEVGAASFPKSPGLGREAALPRMLADAQEAAMSFSPVDLEMHFSRAPKLAVEFHSIHQPMVPSAPMDKLTLADNSKIPKKVDELVGEGAKAHTAMVELAGAGFDEHYLTRLLTAGVLGRKQSRKLVPTRWGITAVDDTLAKLHMGKIREMKQGSGFLLFFNEYLANRFSILLMPGAWEYEGFESWCGPMACKNATPVHSSADSGSQGHFSSFAISEEYEPHEGRTDYAQRQGGGYYAARLGVTEALAQNIKSQYRAIVIREIMPEYDLPVGVWEIRENVRHAMQKRPQKFGTMAEALTALQTQLKLPLPEYKKRSLLLTQTRLADY
ncbi:MAG: hypothetical protein M1530_00690 [Candidatus Marsarchaeota archaeon]|nr:hypothetical protein [Candidatus Marsarchaeota archaeon]